MPYIRIKAYPKDEEIKKRVVDKINQVFLEEWGCPAEAISISVEEIAPDDWADTVVKNEIVPNEKNMMVLNGKKKY